jgi:ubiquinone/menaquinone biosynthesis C-methylase UbiE
MPDVWATFTELDAAMQERLAGVLETRGADPQQQAMRRVFLADIPFPAQARVLEIGCGTGVLTRALAQRAEVTTVVAVDQGASLLEKARKLAADLPNVSFQEADARSLPFAKASFDVVVFDSVLSHVPGPEAALLEAFRVLCPLGYLAIFDGDYATTTVGLGPHDPLQACADAMMAGSVHDRWVTRRLPALARQHEFEVIRTRNQSFVETGRGGYMLSVVERGADILCGAGQISEELGRALKEEAQLRTQVGAFFGHIAYASLVAQKPGARTAIKQP